MVSSPEVPLVLLTEAQRHLRLPISTETNSPLTVAEQDLQDKIDAATAIIWEYLARESDSDWVNEMTSWDDVSVPKQIKAAILVKTGELYRFRGDDAEGPPGEPGFLSPHVRSLLARKRDPIVR